jgi:hypothetical protein
MAGVFVAGAWGIADMFRRFATRGVALSLASAGARTGIADQGMNSGLLLRHRYAVRACEKG